MSVAYSLPAFDQQPRTDTLNLLIVDDERALRDACKEVAESLGFTAFTADNAQAALRVLNLEVIDVVLMDMRLPGTNGLEVLKEIKRRGSDIAVIMMTAYASVNTAVHAMKQGAYDYVTKPFNLEELRLLLGRVSAHVRLAAESKVLRESIKTPQSFSNIVGRTPEMEKMFRIITKVAHSTHPVLILGESGTGKELVARSIHFNGPNRDKPFIPVDCGSLVPTLIESELFGYVKGAFTGAVRSKDGLLAIADGGTVLLDEIGELPVDLQSKLLRALQEKEIRPVGSTRRVPINVRILAATNRDLEAAVQQGTFRKDLFFRLNVVNIRIPVLRERKADIPLLVGHFLERMNAATGVERTISDEALRLMMAYDWPGNIRELESCLERAATLTSGPNIHIGDLPTQVQNGGRPAPSENGHPSGVVPIAEMEREAIFSALKRVGGDKMKAAKLLGIGKTTLYRKLKEYGMSGE